MSGSGVADVRLYIVEGLMLVLVFGTASYLNREPACLRDENPRWCFIHEAQTIAAQGGAQKAYAYTQEVIHRYSDYKTEHLALHYVGMKAYDEAGSIDGAFTLVYGPDQIPDEAAYYNGFQHGLFERFFEVQGARRTRELGNDVCGKYTTADPGSFPEVRTQVLAAECYHAIGHAIMYASENGVALSLKECDVFPYRWMREWCYHGVFMENYYFHVPEYHLGVIRPDASGSSVAPLCERLEERYKAQCVYFVGWVYMQTHPGDFAGAFHECELFPENIARICVARVGRFYGAAVFKDDLSGAISTCLLTPFESECIFGTAIGLQEGIGNFSEENKGTQLCARLTAGARRMCEENLKRSNESLARLVITEL